MENTISLNKYIQITEINKDKYHVFNKKSKKSFEFGKNEASILDSFRRPSSFGELLERNKDRISADRLQKLIEVLHNQGFLESSEVKSTNHLTRIKWGMFNPSKYIQPNDKLVVIFSQILRLLPVPLVLLGIIMMLITEQSMIQLLSNYQISSQNIVITIVIMFLMTVIHELGHATVAIRAGLPVPEMGLMFYWFAPCGYADVSSIHFLKDNNQKIRVLFAGIQVHILVLALGMILLAIFPQSASISIPLIVINLASILINSTFFLKLDGYHILTILFKEPLLREKSIALIMRSKKMDLGNVDFITRTTYYICGFLSVLYIPAFFLSILFRVLSIFIHV